MLAAGTVLTGAHGRYRVLAEHGRGGFGITYRGQRETDGLPVIIKVLRLERLSGWKAFELFERETAVLKALAHAGVPRWVDDAPLGDRSAPRGFALVMELVPGRTLLEIASAGGGLAPGQMLDWFADILEVLAFIHGRSPPVIHRDVNPKNIILRPDGRAVLVDFGCVQAALRAADAPSSTAAGTFGFAPPEQFVGRAEPSCDLHGLAMTFLAMASGRPPEDMPRDGLRVNVGRLLSVDPRLARLLAAMTEPDPRYRLGSAEEALQLLLPIRRDVRERPSLTSWWRPPPVSLRRSPWMHFSPA
jgi:serine/threonine protein kinase